MFPGVAVAKIHKKQSDPYLNNYTEVYNEILRYSINNSIKYGLVEGNPIQENENFHGAVVKEISSAPWDNYKISNIQHKIEDIKILAPCDPKIVFFMGGNFKPSDPEIPQVYTKTSNSIIGPNDTM
ncbi:MAG: hypothetical protein CM1200mP37_9070 [Chloroflexota bacterium]|nr:MAG: hypothetical protein CM1200mP37_9070 [Chloroflexota bacterium]